MITDTARLTLLLFVDHLGLPLRDVLAREPWFERVAERLIAAGGDAYDVITNDMSDSDETIILRAAVLVQHQMNPHQHTQDPCE